MKKRRQNIISSHLISIINTKFDIKGKHISKPHNSHTVTTPPSNTMGHKKTHYEILNVTPSTSPGDMKKVYKELLLSTHPDKTEQNLQNARDYMEKNDISIDEITKAYKVLSDIKLRKQYDEHLLQDGKKNGVYKFGEGVDEVSLDTFEFLEDKEEYCKKCPRCQTDESFKLTDDLLEEYAVECEGRQDGMFQVLTQCTACSLWLKVNFYAADDYEQDED